MNRNRARPFYTGFRTPPGHATITETMDTYGLLFPDAEDLGRGAIDAIFAMPLTE